MTKQSEILGLQNRFDAQMKDHLNAILKLQEQLKEKEHKINELEKMVDKKDEEVRIHKSIVEGQDAEIRSYTMMREKSLDQIEELNEQIKEKESRFVELQEQLKIARETIVFKDENIREAHAWITSALQTTVDHTLQAELRDRIQQYNQLFQTQFVEMEKIRFHLQQLQLEMANHAREKSGTRQGGSHVSDANLSDASRVARADHSQLEVNDNSLKQTGQVQSVAFAPSSLFGMPAYLPTALHPFLMHQHGVPHVAQSDFHSLPQNLQKISSQFDTKEKTVNPVIEHSQFAISESSSEASMVTYNSSTVLINALVPTGQRTDVEKPQQSSLMDEIALIASIARTVGSGGRIKISSTLSNRLGRVIAPLHWYDYKRKYGKLDDFLASHPDLFLIDGDYIQLKKGAQATIAATAAVAKVAAIGPISYSSEKVFLTPLAQSHRLKKVSSLESSPTVQNKNLDGGQSLDDSKSKDQMGSVVSETSTRLYSDRIA